MTKTILNSKQIGSMPPQDREIAHLILKKGLTAVFNGHSWCVTGTGIMDSWVALVGDKFNVPVAGGVTAISQPGYGPYLQTGQLKGLLGGMKGAAEYEVLLGQPGKGTSGIDALNLGNLLVLVLILTSNIILLVVKFL